MRCHSRWMTASRRAHVRGDRDEPRRRRELAAGAALLAPARGRRDARALAVEVGVEQRVQRHDALVVRRALRDEVDDDARLLARMRPHDPADALLVDAPRAVGARCMKTVARGEFQPSASSIALMRTSISPRSYAARISASLHRRRAAVTASAFRPAARNSCARL